MKDILIPTETSYKVLPCKLCKTDEHVSHRQLLCQSNKHVIMCIMCNTTGPTGLPQDAVKGWNQLMETP